MNSASDDVAKYDLIRIESDTMRTILTWTQATKKNFYFDKPRVGKDYQYKLIAWDSAGNSSETTTGKIVFEPGYRKAVKDIKGTVDREKRLISLVWKNESTTVKCIVYRKENDGSYTLYKTLEGDVRNFTDKSISINNIYYYKIQAVYTSGVKSLLSSEVKVKY